MASSTHRFRQSLGPKANLAPWSALEALLGADAVTKVDVLASGKCLERVKSCTHPNLGGLMAVQRYRYAPSKPWPPEPCTAANYAPVAECRTCLN